ncbi:ABC transporter permease [Tunturiibacter lichenicola]|uniref:ABC transporter permease n=1 Tax=Tunturiibacter lichenicola TaxID=2051959 RepID=UPI0021B39FB9|nr:ABC transporter permease [Edaphobacter lichenicola]
MFFRLLMESFVRQRRRKMLAGVAILLGTTAVTAMLALATTIGDRIHKELAVYGANIVVYPKADLLDVKVGGVDVKPASGGVYLKESDLEKLKTIFWANNITGISPEFHMAGMMLVRNAATGGPYDPRAIWHWNDPRMEGSEAFPVTAIGYWFQHPFGALVTGAPQLHPWWRLQGRWPIERSVTATHGERAQEIVLGAALAKRLGLHIGDWISMGTEFEGDIVGIVTTGDVTEQQILYPLDASEQVLPVDQNGKTIGEAKRDISRVEITARTKPEDAFARVDPDSLPPKQREIWYCRPYANSIAYQIREAIPGAQAEQVRRVEQSEGNVLSRISGLMWLISAAALLAAGFAVSAAMATAILERRGEIGLMRSLGASKGAIALLFYAEAGLLALFAGTLGYLFGSGLAAWLGARIFADDGGSAQAVLIPVLLPVIVALALVVAIAGSTPSIRAALRMEPSAILRADA